MHNILRYEMELKEDTAEEEKGLFEKHSAESDVSFENNPILSSKSM